MKPRLAALLTVTALILIAAAVLAQGGSKWPMYRHDSARQGRAEDNALQDTGMSPIWVFPLPEEAGGAVDNDYGTKDEPNFTTNGTWTEGDSTMAPNAYNGNFLYAYGKPPGSPASEVTARWEFPLTNQRGSIVPYYVHVWFPSHAYATDSSGKKIPLHATHAQYTVYIVNDDGSTASHSTYTVDQMSGGNWVLLSTSAVLVRDDQFVRVELTNAVPESDTGTIVCADAVMLTNDSGSVLASPAFAPNDPTNRDDDLVVTALSENRPLQTVTTLAPDVDEYGNVRRDNNGNAIMKDVVVQTGSIRVGAIYGLYAEKQGSVAVDERGTPMWSFPFSTDNWIAGGFSSSPVIHAYTQAGTDIEAAYCAAEDGQVYVISTRSGNATNPPNVIWQGPGYIEDTTAASASGWTQKVSAGRAMTKAGNDDFYQTAAVAPNADGSGDKVASWKAIISTKGNYSVYAWIPPSTSDAIGIPDAKYTVTVGTTTTNATADQRSGGRWALLGKYETTSGGQSISVELSNASEVMKATSPGPRVVSADVIKIVPAELGAFDFSSPVVADDSTGKGKRIYIGTTAGRVYCFEVGNPDPVWVYPNPYDSDPTKRNPIGAVYASPTLANGGVYVGSTDGHVYKIDASSGQLDWAYPELPTPGQTDFKVLGEISSSVAVKGDLCYVGIGSDGSLPPIFEDNPDNDAMAGRVICLREGIGGSLGNGKKVDLEWVYPALSPVREEARGSILYSSPLLYDDNTLAIGSNDGYLIGVDAANGHEIWTDGLPDLVDSIYSSPAGVKVNQLGIPMPMAYVGTQDGGLRSVDLRSGRKDWSYGLTGAVTSSPALAEDRLYVGDMNGLTWAFSSRAGNGSDGREEWNTHEGRIPHPPGNPTAGDGSGKESKVEVDIFNRAEWEAITDGLRLPVTGISDGDLHTISRAEKDHTPSGDPFRYEWGETVYIIAWNCLDPNDPKDPEAVWVKGQKPGSKYQSNTDSTIRLTIKSRGPGDQSDQSTALTMTEKGSFMYTDSKEKKDKIIYYTKYAYVLGTSSSSSTQAPGSRITVSVQELPSTKTDSINKGSSASDCLAPQHPITKMKDPVTGDDVYDHSKFKPQFLVINNPLALTCYDPVMKTTGYVAVDSGGNTSRTMQYADSNDNRHNSPYLRAGLVAHGTNSDEEIVLPSDRSLLNLTGARLSKFRVEREDLEWSGGLGQIYSVNGVTTRLPWEDAPPDYASGRSHGGNASNDYPDIRMRQVGFTMTESRIDPTQESTDLRPGGALTLPSNTATWKVGQTPVTQVISVPKHQPANMPYSQWPPVSTATADTTGYTGHSYVFIDSNGDGHLQRSGRVGSSNLYQSSVSGARAEASRRFHSQVYVPTDYRVDVAEKTYDVGAVPHGFGLTPSGKPQPNLFYQTLGQNMVLTLPGALKTQPLDSSFDEHFKTFTAYNDGNVNMINLRLARYVNPANNLPYPLDLYSDTAEGNAYRAGSRTASYGAYVPAAGIVSALDPQFLAPHPWNLKPVMGLTSRTFHKPRVGESATVLRLPDLPTRLWTDPAFQFDPQHIGTDGKADPIIPQLPSFSIAVPVGTPVGTYSRTLTLFEDKNKNDVFDAGEAVGNPVMDAKVTVTENRLTDGYMPGTRPQVDIPQRTISIGDVSPAVYIDAKSNLQMFWSSSRYGPANRKTTGTGPTAGDPWYLYRSYLPWVRTSNTGGYWSMAQSSGQDQWWTSITGPLPDPNTSGTLYDMFNKYLDAQDKPQVKPGDVQLSSVKFSSPSIALLKNCGNCPPQAFLFFGGEAVRYQDRSSTSQPDIKDHDYKTFYMLLDEEGNPMGSPISSTRDWTMPKYGVRGAASVTRGNPTLWTFWYGGNNSEWRIFYNMGPWLPDPSDPLFKPAGDQNAWSNDMRLPIPRGLSSAAEPNVIPRTVVDEKGNPLQVLDIIYSAYSTYHKNSDIYLTRYQPLFQDVKRQDGSTWPQFSGLDIVELPKIEDEVLVRDPSSAIYSSKNVDWDSDGIEVEVYPDAVSTTPTLINIGDYTRDSQTHARIYTYSDASEPAQVALKKQYRSVVIDTEAGTVKFLRDPGTKAVVTATYRPRAYRLTTDGAADTGPSALFDDAVNTRALVYGQSNFWTPSGWDWDKELPSTDRLWVLWRRPTTVMKGTSVFYKSFRYTIKLNDQIAMNAANQISFDQDPAGPVEVDWGKKRLYFTAVDDGKTFTITYPNAVGNTVEPEKHTVKMDEELDVYGHAFGNLTSEVSNEGQVCIVRDPDLYVNKLWAFWTSTRAGNTDVFYETICPRFYARELK